MCCITCRTSPGRFVARSPRFTHCASVRHASSPRAIIAGNHDRRGMLRAVFANHAYMHETPRRGGYLDEERFTWLHEALRSRPRTRTILALHHPPFQTQVGAFDAQPFAGRERLGDIVRENPHQMLWRPWCGTVAVSAPSTAPTLALHSRGVLRWELGGFLLHRYDWDPTSRRNSSAFHPSQSR